MKNSTIAETKKTSFFSAGGDRKTRVWQRILAALLLVVIWQIIAMCIKSTVLFPSPIQVIGRFFSIWGEPEFWPSIGFSLGRIAGGFFLAFFIGTILAILAGRIRILEILLEPLFITIKSVPIASCIVICLIWLTSSSLSIFIAFLIVLPIIYNNVLGGIKSLDVKMEQVTEIFQVPWKRKLKYVWLPTMKSYLISGCSTALGLAWKSGIAAEIIGIPDGSIGERLYEAKAYFNTIDLFAWTVVIVLLSLLFEKVILALIKAAYRKLERS